MMKRNVCAVTVLTALALVLGVAQAQVQPVQYSYSGTSVPTAIDSNGDGILAGEVLASANGTGGKLTFRALEELGAPIGPTARCPAPLVEFPHRTAVSTATTEDGSMYFERLVAGHLCVNTSTGAFSFEITYEIFGGTGRFEGATGSIATKGTGRIIFAVPGKALYSVLAGTSTGSIAKPN